MADDIKKINDEINKLRAELKKNPLKPFEEKDLETAKSLLSGLRAEIREMSADLDYVAKSFKDSVNELSNQNSYLSDAKKALNGIATVAQKITEYRKGESSLNEKQLKDLQKQAKIKFDELNRIKQSGNLNKLNQEEIIKALDEQEAFNESVEKTIKHQKQVNKEIGLLGTGIGGVSKALSKLGFGDLSQPLTDAIEKTKNARLQMKLNADQIEDINELQRIQNKNYDDLTDDELERFDRLSNIYGMDKKAQDDKKNDIKAQNQDLSTQISKYKNIGDALKDQLTKTNLVDFALKEMIAALSKADKETGELAKAFGTSYDQAASMRNELNTIANLSGDVHMTTSALQKSLIAVNKEFGTATMFSGELLKDFTHLTEAAGYSNEAAARLSKISVATGTDLSKNTEQILGQAVAFNATNKLALNEKEIVEEVAKASKATTLSLGMQPKKLTQAVLAAKALGSSLEKVESISQSLLNFESSISSELEAELLTGKDMNLERARMYALNNDIEGVAREIAGQIGSAADFTKMNVIQQEALAKSVGMTREDLASSLIERQALSKIGEGDKTAAEAYNRLKKQGLSDDEIAARLGDDKLANQLKSQSIQERFNATIEKLRDIFIGLAEPILQIVSPFMNLATTILPLINTLLTPILWVVKQIGESVQGFVSLFSGEFQTGLGLVKQIMQSIAVIWAGVALTTKLIGKETMKNISLQGILSGLLTKDFWKSVGSSIAKVWGSIVSFLGPFGIPVAIAATAGLVGLASSYFSKAGDVFSPADGKTQISTKEGGLFELSPNDDLIAAPGLGEKMNEESSTSSSKQSPTSTSSSPDMSRVEALLSQLVQKQSQPINVSVQVDGKEIAKAVGNRSTELGTSMSTNTYKVQ